MLVSMNPHATGMTQSGGLYAGLRKKLYQSKTLGCWGAGLVDQLKASGTTYAAVDRAIAAGRLRLPNCRAWLSIDSSEEFTVSFCKNYDRKKPAIDRA